jgi:GPH family glycoside/pentoside/hexuronide:cation symporter
VSTSVKLSVKEKLGYGLGDTASNIFFQFVNIFLLYYYTDVFGLSPAAVGTLFVVTRFWDAINDPLMGALADRTHTRWGKYRPYLLWMAIPFGLFGYLAFANPDFTEAGKLIYAYVTYVGLMMAYTAINVPYSALMGVMTPNSEDRTSLASYRFVGAFSGTLLISLSVRPLVRLLGGSDEALGFKLTMALLSVIAVVLFVITFLTTKERVKPQENPEGTSLAKDIKFLFKNRPWIIMVIAGILTLSNVAVRAAVTNHFFKYYAGDDGASVFWFLDRTSLMLSSGALAFIIGIFFTGKLSKRFGKRNSLMGLTILNGFTLVGFYFIPAEAYGTMLIVNAIGNILAGPTPALVWSIYTDVADYGEWKFKRRTTGLVFSAAMFAQKMGLTIGGGVAGWMLSGFGFVANEEQSDAAMLGIRLMFSILPGALALANGIILLWYPLTDTHVAEIQAELSRLREAEPKEATETSDD